MIRAFDRFYAKHPRIAAALMIAACAACLYAAAGADSDNDTALRLQLMASRSAT
ncbi:hypothetical protein [Paraburkholderia sp. SOS3]|uniref:hypothetical protein n=1 Tax=Paraburkholderia sp. SOS3 TaxID=1926494 RepID=UPI0012EC7510|nr:hypothetical protein [Paraburkholderia sp. SOS3]